MKTASRILVVEDNSVLAVTIAQALRQSGYEVLQTVSTGEEALESVPRDAPDLVLMDIELAGLMDGMTAAEQIWTTFRIPIIYLTSYATPAIIERAKRSEPFGFLVKPFHLKELHATIETALYKFRMEQALQEADRMLAHEIQERHQIEQALRENELRFRRISELISDYAYVFRIDADGTWVREWVTDAFMRITAYTPDELDADGGWFVLVHPDDQAVFLQHQQALLAGEKMITEYRIVTRHQDVFWLRDYGYPVWSDALGRVVQVYGAAQDVSEQKQADLQLRQLWRRLDFLLTASPTVIYTASPDQAFRLTFISENVQRVLDYTPPEFLSHDAFWMEHVHPDDRAGVRQGIALACETGHATQEYRIFHHNGSVVWLRDEMVLSRDVDAQPVEIIGSWSNITERKQAADERHRLEMQLYQAQRLEALGTLAGGIAHDFNNILGTMLGYTDLLREMAGDGSQEQVFLERVHRAGKRAKDLVQQVLTFSRHEMQPLEPLNLAPVIEEALHFMRATMPANIALNYRLQPNCAPILANATQIHQVIVNLCLNAAHAMKPRGGAIAIVLEQTCYSSAQPPILGLTPGDYVKITVTDTGIGMPPDVKERIFEPFFTTKAAGEGTGLGLSVVHGIIKSHHGVIAVASEPGQGTQFRLFFPTTAAAPEIPLPVAEERIRDVGRASILVIDDELALVKLYEIALTKRGYHVTALTDSREALRLFRRQPLAFDVLVVDQDLPDLTGIELSAQVLQERPGLPIILVTGYSADISDELLKTTGIRHCFMKPLNANDLIQAIRTILSET